MWKRETGVRKTDCAYTYQNKIQDAYAPLSFVTSLSMFCRRRLLSEQSPRTRNDPTLHNKQLLDTRTENYIPRLKGTRSSYRA